MTPSVDPDARKLAEAIAEELRSYPVFGDPLVIDVGRDVPPILYLSADHWTSSIVQHRGQFLRVMPTLAQLRNIASHEATALGLVQQRIEVQTQRHRIATAHGLAGDQRRVLDAGAIGIDRVTAWLLAESGIDPIDLVTLHRKYSRETGNKSHVSCIVSVPPFRKAEVIIADGDGAPVIACGIPVGSGAIPSLLFGNVLILKVHIPATLRVAAAGRPLGDLAATGILMLDERRIEHAHSTDDGATLTLEADLTTIGEARRAMGRA